MQKSKISNIKQIILENVETSTSHGIPNIFRSRNIILKILWTISVMGSFGYCVYCLSRNFRDFFEFKTNTQIKYERVNQIQFPAITFCNQYPFNINSNSYLIPIMKLGFSQMTSWVFQPDNILNYSNLMEDAKYFLQNQTIVFKNELESIAFTIDFLLISCRFNQNECFKSDFETFFSPKYGFCYKFNGNQSRGIRNIGMTGKKNGLSLELYVGEPTIEYDIGKTSGIELFIHNWSSIPVAEAEGISLPGGLETNIAINQFFMKKQPRPYSNCIEDKYSQNSFSSHFYLETVRLYKQYEQKGCLNLCYHKNIKKKCGCYDPDFFFAESNLFCSFEEFTSCILEYRKSMADSLENLACFEQCPEECDSVKYVYQTSQSNFPSPFYKKILMEFDKALNESKRGYVFENLDKYVLAVNIYYDEIATTTIEETPAKTIEQLVAEIGGFLGLCIGISFLTLIEIFDAIIKILLLFFSKSKINNESK
ncbi:acid-sensing ion channel 5 [Brachionus plicatilis]|uniref:Acid-sensing ion channel 5 n=1 Tax=Brachionus plicatilis TaxID=10195 RepID=A0A3M7PBZ0_BRAPC|nr:acid-sensing ion channel 5 [Brachionus plicatilis]